MDLGLLGDGVLKDFLEQIVYLLKILIVGCVDIQFKLIDDVHVYRFLGRPSFIILAEVKRYWIRGNLFGKHYAFI